MTQALNERRISKRERERFQISISIVVGRLRTVHNSLQHLDLRALACIHSIRVSLIQFIFKRRGENKCNPDQVKDQSEWAKKEREKSFLEDQKKIRLWPQKTTFFLIRIFLSLKRLLVYCKHHLIFSLLKMFWPQNVKVFSRHENKLEIRQKKLGGKCIFPPVCLWPDNRQYWAAYSTCWGVGLSLFFHSLQKVIGGE